MNCCEEALMENKYLGYTKVTYNDIDLARFYEGDEAVIPDLLYNQYLLIFNEDGEVIDKYYNHKGTLERVKWKPINSRALGQIKPLNTLQELGFHMLQYADSTIKMFNSDYGVGKSFLCTNYMMKALEDGKYDKAVLIRPNIGLEDYPSLGSTPGDFNQKSLPWFGMVGDIVGGMDYVSEMISNNQLELAPMETLRGRSFRNSIVLVEECGNLTTATCRLITSRIGEGSLLLMCGDESQTDKKRFREDNGLKNMSEGLKGNELFSYLRLEGCVRSKTAQLCELF